MATWNAAYELAPAGSADPSTLDTIIQGVKEEVRLRAGNEHGTYANTSMGADGSQTKDWVHKRGSAVAYYQSNAPTVRPDGVTALDSTGSNDNGRVWISNGAQNYIKCWNGAWSNTSVQYATSTGTASTALKTPVITDQSSRGLSLKMRAISIGSWNMDTTAEVFRGFGSVPTIAKIVGLDAYIHSDDLGGGTRLIYPITQRATDPADKQASGYVYASSQSNGYLRLVRLTNGIFDHAYFNSTGFNRGWVTVWYYE